MVVRYVDVYFGGFLVVCWCWDFDCGVRVDSYFADYSAEAGFEFEVAGDEEW